MAKVMQFDVKGKKTPKTADNTPKLNMMGYRTENDAQLAEQADTLIDIFGNTANRLCGKVEATLEAISDVPERDTIEFSLINPSETETFPEDHPLYGATAIGRRGDELYVVFAELQENEEDDYYDGIPFRTGVEKVDENGKIFNLDINNNWVPSDEEAVQADYPAWSGAVFAKGGAKAELLDLLLDEKEEITEDEWRKYCSRYSLLIKLLNTTHGLLAMDTTQNGEVVLRSIDDLHNGFAIRQEKNSLVLCQWIDQFEMEEFLGLEDGDVYYVEEGKFDEDGMPNEYLRNVDTMTVPEAKTFCRHYVDRYSHDGLFTFPLSKKKSVRTWADIVKDPNRILRSVGSLGELTESETKALKSLKKAIGVRY